jgi:hypothetical protein
MLIIVQNDFSIFNTLKKNYAYLQFFLTPSSELYTLPCLHLKASFMLMITFVVIVTPCDLWFIM